MNFLHERPIFFHLYCVPFSVPQVPVDVYGVGSYLMNGNYAFTADVVLLEERPCAKVGRVFKPNPRLQEVVL